MVHLHHVILISFHCQPFPSGPRWYLGGQNCTPAQKSISGYPCCLQSRQAVLWPRKKAALFPTQSAYPNNRKQFIHILGRARSLQVKRCLKKNILTVEAAIDTRRVDLRLCRDSLCCRLLQTVLCSHSSGRVSRIASVLLIRRFFLAVNGYHMAIKRGTARTQDRLMSRTN